MVRTFQAVREVSALIAGGEGQEAESPLAVENELQAALLVVLIKEIQLLALGEVKVRRLASDKSENGVVRGVEVKGKLLLGIRVADYSYDQRQVRGRQLFNMRKAC